MVALGMLGLVIGFALGLRFTVFVLLPLEVAALTAATVISGMGQVNWVVALLGFVTFSISCQIAYAVSLSLPAIRSLRAN